MTAPPIGVERRMGQRFAFNLPVSLRQISTAAEGLGFTQDLSSRGAFFFTDLALDEGDEIELTLKMPSEITLGESMRVCCRGRVLRVVRPVNQNPSAAIADSGTAAKPRSEAEGSETEGSETKGSETKIGVAVCLLGYEYLPETEEASSTFRRISALHSQREQDRPVPAIAVHPTVS
jgi:hypothetical protein